MAYMSSLNTGGGVLPITTTLYGVCDTAASTAAKVVTVSNVDSLADGFRIAVLFTNGNSVSSGVTININNIGAISISSIYIFGNNTLLDLIYISNTFYILNNNIKEYLPLSGGTLSGNLSVVNTSSESSISVGALNRTGMVKYYDSSTGYFAQLRSTGLTADTDILVPNKAGRIALSEDVVKLTNAGAQVIQNTSSNTILFLKGINDNANLVWGAINGSGNVLGYTGFDSTGKPVILNSGGGLAGYMALYKTITVANNESVTIEFPNACGYIIRTVSTNSSSISTAMGAGYGKTSNRNKLTVINGSSYVTYTVSDTVFGVTITNTCGMDINVSYIMF